MKIIKTQKELIFSVNNFQFDTIEEIENLIIEENLDLVNINGYLYILDFYNEVIYDCEDYSKDLFLEDISGGFKWVLKAVDNFEALYDNLTNGY